MHPSRIAMAAGPPGRPTKASVAVLACVVLVLLASVIALGPDRWRNWLLAVDLGPTWSWIGGRLGRAIDSLTQPYLLGPLILVVIFRSQLRALLDALVETIPQRGVKFEVKGVSFEIGEPAALDPGSEHPLFSRSPFELDEERPLGEERVLFDLAPQIHLPVSDYMGQRWLQADKQAATDLHQVGEDLEKGCQVHGVDLRRLLDGFASRLEATRFPGAQHLSHLIDTCPALASLVEDIRSKQESTPHDRLVLLSVGIAHAQRGRWKEGKQLLENLVLAAPPYLPAADAYIACAYNQLIDESMLQAEIDTQDFLQRFGEIEATLDALKAAVGSAAWGSFGTSAHNKPYYKRELSKVAGLIYALLGENTLHQERRRRFFEKALTFLEQCATTLDGEEPSALDLNNLADLYWQLGRYEEAHARLDDIGRLHDRPDPTFCHTRSQTFWAEGRKWQALHAVQEFTADQARTCDEVTWYVKNQLHAAKLAFAMGDSQASSAHRMALVVAILEAAQIFAEGHVEMLLEPSDLCTLYEMLAFAYGETPGTEARAVQALEKLQARSCAASVSPAEAWRWRVAMARARIRLARAHRVELSRLRASQERQAAHALLADGREKLKAFPVEGPSFRRQSRHFLLHFDTLVAGLELAEESFQQGELKTARSLLEGLVSERLFDLSTCLKATPALRQPFGAAHGSDFAQRCVEFQARHDFLMGRVRAREDSAGLEAGVLAEVAACFQRARGTARLDALIDLDYGQLLLNAALTGKGDVLDWYDRALMALERACQTDHPALRAEALRALAHAYAVGGLARRRQHKLQPQKT